MFRVFRNGSFAALGLSAAVIIGFASNAIVLGQSGKPKKAKPANAAEVTKLDAKLDVIQRSFLNDTASIIKGYEDAGQFERAKVLLEVLLKLDPKNEEIRKRIEKLDEKLLDQSEFEMDLDPSKPWQQVGMVSKDRLVRLEVEGDYKFSASISVGPEGVSTKDPANDLVVGVPLGAVVAVVIPPESADARNNQNADNNQKKLPNPFSVGAKFEQAIKNEGMLLIKVNVPAGSKCTGKLKVKVGGVVKA